MFWDEFRLARLATLVLVTPAALAGAKAAILASTLLRRLPDTPGVRARDSGRYGTVRLTPAPVPGGAAVAVLIPASKCQTSLGGLCGRCGALNPNPEGDAGRASKLGNGEHGRRSSPIAYGAIADVS